MKAFVSLASVFAWPCRVRTCVCGGRIAVDLGRAAAPRLTPGFFATRIWSSLPSLLEELLRASAGRSRRASRRRCRASLVPNLTSPETANGCAAPCASTRIVSPTSMCFLPPSLVDHDLVRPGPVAVDERERVEPRLGRVDGEAEVRCAAEADHLAVRRRSGCAMSATPPIAACDVRQRLHLRQQRLVERRQVLRSRRR